MVNILQFWKPAVEILILWFAIYQIMLFCETTHAKQLLRGILILFAAFFIFEKFNFQVLVWLMTKLFGISVIAILIIFHPEIRQGLLRLGQRHFFSIALKEEEVDRLLKAISEAGEFLIREKHGALIAIENGDSLRPYVETGVKIDANISSDLIQAIFTPNNPLHDGGLIIQQGRISSAGCLFPLAQNNELNRIFGMRHRAALGLSEETDAVIVVVSEERQDISLVYGGKLYKDIGREELFGRIKEIMVGKNA
ncbi:MAG: diadenylate cyclase CdaA [Candidatus Omnitrophica bacterium]|nr:diadenylate cyclase CdaA [Candidatus Omnitrophota bacterium]